tara:strand:+ start:405 stop:809 length:405 start_codon:yes stop_codon:yes gene_type:complete
MDMETDDALIGIGKLHRVIVWDGQREREKEMLWDLPSRNADVFQIPLLKSETAIIDRPCPLLANEFGLVKREKRIYAASLTTDEPCFCIAAAGALRTARGTRVSRRSPCRPMTISQPTRIAMSRCSGPKTGSTG